MAIVLQLRFPSGRYHATPWGRHVNEGVPEWPPSPWRLLRALIAVWRRTCPEIPADQVRRILEPLSESPHFVLPPHRVAHTRHFMPWEKKGPLDRTLVFDTFVVIGREQPLYIGWPTATLAPQEGACLRRLVAHLHVLGRAETWVEAAVVTSSESAANLTWNCQPALESEPNPVAVLCPDPDLCFDDTYFPKVDAKKLAKGKLAASDYLFDCPRWHLCLDTETIHAERWPTVPGAKWINYTRPAEIANPVRPRYPRARPVSTIAQFMLDGPVLPLVANTLPVAEAFRRALMGSFNRWCRAHASAAHGYQRTDAENLFASQTLAGKDQWGKVLSGQRHAYYLPSTTQDDRRHIRHVIVYARSGFSAAEIAAMHGLKVLHAGKLEPLRVQLVGLGRPADIATALTRPSAVWQSVTPFLGHPAIGERGRIRYLRKGLRREWRRLAEQVAELRDVQLLDVQHLATDELNRHGFLPAREFVRSRWKHGGREAYRPAGMFRITLSREVAGPISLGYASHFGMGVFEPCDC